MEAPVGAIVMDTSAGPATVRPVEDETDPSVAVTVVVPCPALVSNP